MSLGIPSRAVLVSLRIIVQPAIEDPLLEIHRVDLVVLGRTEKARY